MSRGSPRPFRRCQGRPLNLRATREPPKAGPAVLWEELGAQNASAVAGAKVHCPGGKGGLKGRRVRADAGHARDFSRFSFYEAVEMTPGDGAVFIRSATPRKALGRPAYWRLRPARFRTHSFPSLRGPWVLLRDIGDVGPCGGWCCTLRCLGI